MNGRQWNERRSGDGQRTNPCFTSPLRPVSRNVNRSFGWQSTLKFLVRGARHFTTRSRENGSDLNKSGKRISNTSLEKTVARRAMDKRRIPNEDVPLEPSGRVRLGG